MRSRTPPGGGQLGALSRAGGGWRRESYTHIRCRSLPREGPRCRYLSALKSFRAVPVWAEFGFSGSFVRKLPSRTTASILALLELTVLLLGHSGATDSLAHLTAPLPATFNISLRHHEHL